MISSCEQFYTRGYFRKQFGCELISDELLARFERIIDAPLHQLLKRRIFFAHRELDAIITAKERHQPFYLYTGRGPSSEALHVGHLVPFMFIQWLQKVLQCPLVIQLSDDEKFLFKEEMTLEEVGRLSHENAKDIIALGFDPKLTFIFRNLDYVHNLYPTALEIQKKTTFNQVKGIFGFNESTNIGAVAFPAMEAAPAFAAAFPGLFGRDKSVDQIRCFIPYAIDQDPYFRMCRDVAPRLQRPKPSSIISKFIPALQGAATKMSGSKEQSAIFVTDTPKQIKTKINKYAFSGGRDTAAAQREFGADVEIDVSYQYLRVFLEDDQELEQIRCDYKSGMMLTGQVKARLIEVLTQLVSEHQRRRAAVTDAMVAEFCNPDRPELRAHIERACKAAAAAAGAANAKVSCSS